MPSSNGTYVYPSSAVSLLDPKRMKSQLSNGSPASFPVPSSPHHRSSSEHLDSTSYFDDLFDFDSACHAASRENAHASVEGNPKSTSKSDLHAPTSLSQARQLLDPKTLSNSNRFKRLSEEPPVTSYVSDAPQTTLPDDLPTQTNKISLSAIDDDNTIQNGIGSHIERLHGISEREARPLKKQKRDPCDGPEDKKNASFTGGRGGELGDYVKEKRKEGLRESKDAIVDLTAGAFIW